MSVTRCMYYSDIVIPCVGAAVGRGFGSASGDDDDVLSPADSTRGTTFAGDGVGDAIGRGVGEGVGGSAEAGAEDGTPANAARMQC